MTDVAGSQGVRGKRKSAGVAGAVVLAVVAVMLAIAWSATRAGLLLWVALLAAVLAVALALRGRRARRTPPGHAEHPHLTHPEDHPKDEP